MKNKRARECLVCLILIWSGYAATIHVNQVAYERLWPKKAVVSSDVALPDQTPFTIINAANNAAVYTGVLGADQQVSTWFAGTHYRTADFSTVSSTGTFKIKIASGPANLVSHPFRISKQALFTLTIPDVLRYFRLSRADHPEVWEYDSQCPVYGSSRTVDVRGGWYDASGDISKYLSHLSFANFMNPQQSPLLVWVLADVAARIPALLDTLGLLDSVRDEAAWGADFLLRMLDPAGYFYATVFDDWSGELANREVCAYGAPDDFARKNGNYQAAFREGGGMAVAALARMAALGIAGYFTPTQYLAGARKGFAHLETNNLKYADDGTENIIDDYTALMAATELWIATNEVAYKTAAQQRAQNLIKRMTPGGWWVSDAASRPFWHASDAGLPVIALARYLDKESDNTLAGQAKRAIQKALEYHLSVSHAVENPFDYGRQHFRFGTAIKHDFFMPHDNETNYWYQGESARLASLTSAMLIGGGKVYAPAPGIWRVPDSLADFAGNQISWILGRNPFEICFMYGFGKQNPLPDHGGFGHGPYKGGISNGITGNTAAGDGSGIEYPESGWRWHEQWIPHAAWYLLAVAAITEVISDDTILAIQNSLHKKTTGPVSVRIIGKKLLLLPENQIKCSLKWHLFDARGRLLQSAEVEENSTYISFDIATLSQGVYFLKNSSGYYCKVPWFY